VLTRRTRKLKLSLTIEEGYRAGIEQARRAILAEASERCGGDRVATARMLRLPLPYYYRLVKKYRIALPPPTARRGALGIQVPSLYGARTPDDEGPRPLSGQGRDSVSARN
jgi:hypothetical protein